MDDLQTGVFSLCLTRMMLVSLQRPRQCYGGRTILDEPDTTRAGGVSGGVSGGLGGGRRQLKCVASGGSFVVLVALQGERGNANVKVGAISPLDAKRPPHVATGGL